MARFIIDYDTHNNSDFIIEEADTAQAAVDNFCSYMPMADDKITIVGVYKEVKNWRVKEVVT